MIRFVSVLTLCLFLTTPVSAKSFLNAQEITGNSGVKAWLVNDDTVPVIAISVMFKGGAAMDPNDKVGVANLMSALMDEGAGDNNAQAFQKKLKDHAIQFSFSAGRDGFYGQVKTTVKHQNIAATLLKDAITAPRFDADAIERMRASILTSIRYNSQDAGWHAQDALFKTLYGDHPYARQISGTMESVGAIKRADIVAYHQQIMTRDNVMIGIAGDINASDTTKLIDMIFGDLPNTAQRREIPFTPLNTTKQVINAPWDGPQSVIMMAQKGVARSDKNWFTAQLINYILGGGGFSSRLMDEVRVKRGLTYGISTGIIDYKYAPLMLGQVSVARDKVDETIDVIKQQWQRMIDKGVTKKELADAKSYMIGSLPLSLSSTNAIAGVLVQMQEDNLPIDYLDKRADDINRITLNDANSFAKLWLNTDQLTIAVAGANNNK